MKNNIKLKYALFAACCIALTGCEDMNSVNREYLDRGESVYLAKVDSVTFVVGLNKVWFKWWLSGDPRVTKTEIRWTEGIETKTREYPVDRSQNDSPVMETVLYDFPEGSYTFEFINRDDEGHRSISVNTATVEIIGDRYMENMHTRPIAIATKFGNGYALVWGASDCLYSDLMYRNTDGEMVRMRLPADSDGVAPRILLYDYDGTDFFQITYYIRQTPVFTDTIVVPQFPFANFNDISGTLTSSTTTILGPGNFDLGGESVGFHDSNTTHDPGSGGANYRPNLGDFGSAAVDIEGGGNIGYSNAGEWLQYTVNVVDEDYYEIDWNISVNTAAGSACSIEVDGTQVASYSLVNNGSWNDWRYYCERNGIIPPYLYLTEGKHTVKFVWEAGGFNFNGLRLKKIDPNHITYMADRTGWTAESRNGYNPWTEGGGGEPFRVLDGNRSTGWHSQTGTALPQCLVVDMLETKHVDRIVMWHLTNGLTNNWIYYRDIEIYLTDTPVSPDVYQTSWGASAATYLYPGNIDPITVNLAPDSEGRYLILYFPTSRSNTYISFAELNVYVVL
jgi:hypothetical protein